jgi:hypothetical protein
VLIGNIVGIVVDEKGRVFIADNQQYSILVFDPNGNLVTTIGREGRGPGEYQNINAITANSNRLFIYDESLKRISVFSLDSFTLFSIFSINSGNVNHVEEVVSRLTQIYTLGENRLLVQYEEFPLQERINGPPTQYRFYYMDEIGEFTSDAILQLPATEFLMTAYGEGTYSAVLNPNSPVETFPALPPREGSVEYVFRSLEQPIFAINLLESKLHPDGKWLSSPKPLRSIGSTA